MNYAAVDVGIGVVKVDVPWEWAKLEDEPLPVRGSDFVKNIADIMNHQN